jgi:hypothetical protein
LWQPNYSVKLQVLHQRERERERERERVLKIKVFYEFFFSFLCTSDVTTKKESKDILE